MFHGKYRNGMQCVRLSVVLRAGRSPFASWLYDQLCRRFSVLLWDPGQHWAEATSWLQSSTVQREKTIKLLILLKFIISFNSTPFKSFVECITAMFWDMMCAIIHLQIILTARSGKLGGTHLHICFVLFLLLLWSWISIPALFLHE